MRYLKYWMIFQAFCIGLVMGVLIQPCMADASKVNDPSRVDEAIQRASTDRRFRYPEGRIKEFPWKFKFPEREPKMQSPKAVEVRPFNISLLRGVAYLLIGMVAAFFIFIIIRLLLPYYLYLKRKPYEDAGAKEPGVEDLSPSGYLATAERLMREGRFAEALSALMMALLLYLDAQRMIRYHRSSTNREYLGRLRVHPILFSIVGEFMHHFEQMRYGRKTPDSDGLAYLMDLYRQVVMALPSQPREAGVVV